MSSVFNITIQQIFDLASAFQTDAKGLDEDRWIKIFNIGYLLYLTEMEKTDADLDTKEVEMVYDEDGVSYKNLDTDRDGAMTTKFYRPYEVRLKTVNSSGDICYSNPLPRVSKFGYQWGYRLDADKIYFENFKDYFENLDTSLTVTFVVTYVPQFELLDEGDGLDFEIYMHPKTLPAFVQFIVATFNSVEEMPDTASEKPQVLFDQYFENLDDMINDSRPLEFSLEQQNIASMLHNPSGSVPGANTWEV